MRFSIIIFLCLIAFFACNPCEKYQNEVYIEDTFHHRFDSAGMKRMKLRLKDYNELELKTLDFETYRMVYGSVFVDTAHLIRIEKDHSNYHYIHKKLLLHPDAPPPPSQVKTIEKNPVVETIEKKLNAKDWEKFIEIIYKNNYWTLAEEIDKYGADGGIWVIEGRRPDAEHCGKRSYHFVARWSPDEGEFWNICQKFDEIVDSKEK